MQAWVVICLLACWLTDETTQEACCLCQITARTTQRQRQREMGFLEMWG